MNAEVGTQVIVQARLGSTRLPGKVLLELQGQPVLAHVCRRAAAASRVDRLIVATTDLPEDEPIVAWCRSVGVPVVRGPAADVLARYLVAAEAWPCRQVVRLTADCPVVDPGLVDAVVGLLTEGRYDYVSNLHPPTLPIGFDVEALPLVVLQRVGRVATLPSHREHVTLYIRENRDTFRVGNVAFGRDRSAGRFVLDHPEDYEFFRRLFELIPATMHLPSVYELLRLVDAHPELAAINAKFDRYEGVRRSVGGEHRPLQL